MSLGWGFICTGLSRDKLTKQLSSAVVLHRIPGLLPFSLSGAIYGKYLSHSVHQETYSELAYESPIYTLLI